MLKSPLPLPEVDENEIFPQINRIVPNIKGGELANINIKELLAKLKSKQLEEKDGIYIYTVESESYKCTFDASNLKTVCDILNTTNLIIKIYGTMRPMLLIDEYSGNMAIMSTIRHVQ